jgi:methyl-accepting chemotaxis protein
MPDVSTVLNAKAAIARHIQWKITLQLAITMQEPLSADHVNQILHFRQCAIGRWLDSAATLPMRGTPEYADLMRKHIDFHHEMKRISDLISDARYENAARSISPTSSFLRSSKALANAVMAYDSVAAIAVPA